LIKANLIDDDKQLLAHLLYAQLLGTSPQLEAD
jgi:hypothetical protein